MDNSRIFSSSLSHIINSKYTNGAKPSSDSGTINFRVNAIFFSKVLFLIYRRTKIDIPCPKHYLALDLLVLKLNIPVNIIHGQMMFILDG